MQLDILPLSTPIEATIGELAERRLRESPYFFLKNLSCQFEQGILTLRGSVPQPQLQQIAERIVARVEGVLEVVNRVEVFDPARAGFRAPAARNAG